MRCCATPAPDDEPDPKKRRRRRGKEPPCSSVPARTESPRAEGDGPSQEDRHLSTFTDTKQMQSRLSVPRNGNGDRARRSSRQTVRFAERDRERRQSEPVTGGRAVGRAAEVMRTESQMPVVLIGQIEATKQALDTLIQQDLRRHRKKSGALVDAVDRMMELMRDFEKLCTDEDKWRLLVHEVERCTDRVRSLITEFQEQTYVQRVTNFRSNTSNFDSLTEEIGQTIRTLKLSLAGTGGAGLAASLRYSELGNPDRETVRAAAVRQIPVMNGGFFGREDVMRRLMTALDASTDSRKICVLSGLRGSGKTVVATELASRLAEDYPDSHFFADLLPWKDGGGGMDSVSRLSGAFERSTSAEDMGPMVLRSDSNLRRDLTEGNFQHLNVKECMRMVIRARTGSALVLDSASTTELQSLYHECFANKFNILVLENAIDPQQVQALLPRNGSCLVIVTSMRHVPVPGAVASEQIEPLSDVDAHTMLKSIDARLQQSDLEELSSLCGNLPLALQVVGGALSLNPDIAPSKMARKLRKGGGGGAGGGIGHHQPGGQGGVLPSPHHQGGQHQQHSTSLYGLGPSGDLARTLYGTLRVSYEFLSDGPRGARETLQQLSVFADTFDLPAAEAVLMMGSDEVEEHVSELLVNNMLEKAAALGGRAEGHYRYRMRAVVREFAISMRGGGGGGGGNGNGNGGGANGNGGSGKRHLIRTKLYEERFMNHYFERIIQANVVARHKSEIGQRIWDNDRGNFLKAIKMAESIPIREFELGYKGRAILKLCYPARARIVLYERCVKMAEPLNNNDTLAPVLVELALAYHDAGDDTNARKCFERVKVGMQQQHPQQSMLASVELDKDGAAPHASIEHPLRASAGDLVRTPINSIGLSMRDDMNSGVNSEREFIFQAHSTVEDEEALLHLEQLLTGSPDGGGGGGGGGNGGSGEGGGSAQHGTPSSGGSRSAIAPTISTLKARLRRNTLQRASSVEPLGFQALLDNHDDGSSAGTGAALQSHGNGVSASGGLSVRGRSRQVSASTGHLPSSSGSNASLTPWPGAADGGDDALDDEPFVDTLAPSRTRPERSSSDGDMAEMRRRSSSGGGGGGTGSSGLGQLGLRTPHRSSGSGSIGGSSLPTVPASPQSQSASSGNSTPTPTSSGASSTGGARVGAASVSDVTVVLAGGDGAGGPPPLAIGESAVTPPPPSPLSRTARALGAATQGGEEEVSPPAGSLVESPILIATKSLFQTDKPSTNAALTGSGAALGAAASDRSSSSSSIVTAASASSLATVSGVDQLPAAYIDGGASLELAGRKRALRRVLLPDLEPEPEPELPEQLELIPGGAKTETATIGGLPIQFQTINDLCIPYSDLEWAGGDKSRARVAGGAMGEVFAAEHHGADVAVKEMKELVQISSSNGNGGGSGIGGGSGNGSLDEEMLKDFRAEVELLASCRCPNVVMFVGYCFERATVEDGNLSPTGGPASSISYRLAVVTEFMARGSLWDNLHRRRVELRYSRRLRMLLDVVKGMQYLRHKKIVHCDLKTPNLLVDRQFLIKVADFGLARLHKDSIAAQVSVRPRPRPTGALLLPPALLLSCESFDTSIAMTVLPVLQHLSESSSRERVR
jgi:hypothetical protein